MELRLCNDNSGSILSSVRRVHDSHLQSDPSHPTNYNCVYLSLRVNGYNKASIRYGMIHSVRSFKRKQERIDREICFQMDKLSRQRSSSALPDSDQTPWLAPPECEQDRVQVWVPCRASG